MQKFVQLFLLVVFAGIWFVLLLMELLEGGCSTDQSKFIFYVFFEHIVDIYLVLVCRPQRHFIMIAPS